MPNYKPSYEREKTRADRLEAENAALFANGERLYEALLAFRFPAGDTVGEISAQARAAMDAWRALVQRGDREGRRHDR